MLDLGWFRHESPSVITPRMFALDTFNLAVRTTELSPHVVARWQERSGGLVRWLGRRPLNVVRQREGDFAVDDRVIGAADGVLLVGYWQSEAYFSDARDVIRSELRFPGLSSAYTQSESTVANPSAVSVHVRRGDYVTSPQTNAVHGALGVDYYRRALAHVANRVSKPSFIVFSDDPEWVERELARELPLTVVSGGDPVQELGLMSRCTHHVIANSSFSWWGAWLGEREGSVIVAPERWFADPNVETRDIVPARWRRL
ncbi:MAG TPA: alpha-1,2-fucosyltransferase [Gaiellaceae bacterium]